MSQLPVVLSENQSVPALSPDMMAAFGELQNAAFAGIGGGESRRFIRVRTTSFLISDGGDGEAVPFDSLYGVLLGVNPVNHAVWYKKKYDPSQQENVPPDLVWYFPDNNTFPDALPKELRQKVELQGKMRWDFAIRRRSVWALVRSDPANRQMYIDFENPVILDIPSSSMYGDSNTANHEYRWASLAAFCQRMSRNGVVVYPGMFPIQIVPDAKANRGVVLFKPAINAQTGGVQFLSADIINEVFQQATSERIKQLCEVQEKLTFGDAPQQAAPIAQPQPEVAPQPAPAMFASAPAAPAKAPAPAKKPRKADVEDGGTSSLLAEAERLLGAQQAAAPAAAATPQDNIMAMMGALSK